MANRMTIMSNNGDGPNKKMTKFTQINHISCIKEQSITMAMPLCQQFQLASDTVALRTWIIDNSASMNRYDQHRFTHEHTRKALFSNPTHRTSKCSRWEELKETALFHAHLSVMTHTPTLIHLVNPSPNMPQDYEITSTSSRNYEDQRHR